MLRSTNVALACVVGFLIANVNMTLWAATPTPAETRPASAGEAVVAMRLWERANGMIGEAQRRMVSRSDSDRLVAKLYLEQAAALLGMAQRLDPTEPRYPRLLADVMEYMGDAPGLADALKAYAALQPDDQTAQIQRIELYTDQMQSADARLDYLKRIVSLTSLPAEVRSAAAKRAALVLAERSDKESDEMLQQALKLNPLNIEALELQYARMKKSGTPEQRVAALLAILRSNPANFDRLSELAAELAAAGMTKESLDWYALGMKVSAQSQMTVDPEYAMNYALELLMDGQAKEAAAIGDKLLTIAPDDYRFLMLRMLIARAMDDKNAAEGYSRQGHNALANQLALVRAKLTQTAATTQPVGGELIEVPDLSGDVALVKALADPRAREAYVSSVSELAWFEGYFRKDNLQANRLTKVLLSVLPEGDATAARMTGWSYLLEGKADEAKVKLSAVADKDPLAGLGLVQLMRVANPAGAKEAAQKLLDAHSSGPLGAVLLDAFRDLGVSVRPQPRATALKQELDRIPSDWMKVLLTPNLFYALRAQPLKTAHAYGEPILAKVTVENISDYDLTVGPYGVIHPDLAVDAQLLGTNREGIAAVCYDRIDRQVVLKAHQAMTQVVRLDQGRLAQVLANDPIRSVPITFYVRTNPAPSGNDMRPLPGGYGIELSRVVERSGFAVNRGNLALITDATGSHTPGEKIRNLELAAFMSSLLRQQDDAQTKSEGERLLQFVNSAAGDADPGVQMWARYLSARYAPEDMRQAKAQQLLKDENWENRLAGLLAARELALDQQKSLFASMSGDQDELLKRHAAATMQLLVVAPPAAGSAANASQPSTMPTPDVVGR